MSPENHTPDNPIHASTEPRLQRPEELVRQEVVRLLTQELGYPKDLLILEKKLQTLSMLFTKNHNAKLPHRRMDILVVTPKSYIHQGERKSCRPFQPLLLIECKAKIINKKTFFQILGYNNFIGAPYIALTSAKQHLLGSFNRQTQSFDFAKGLPAFSDLMHYYINTITTHSHC